MSVPANRVSACFVTTAILAMVVGIGTTGCQQQREPGTVGPPSGKTGNEWTEDDFSDSKSALALQGGPEFVDFCKQVGTCELTGDVLEKFKEILKKHPVESDEEFDHFAVVVRTRLVENGLLPEGDPDRYQYKVSMLGMTLASQ